MKKNMTYNTKNVFVTITIFLVIGGVLNIIYEKPLNIQNSGKNHILTAEYIQPAYAQEAVSNTEIDIKPESIKDSQRVKNIETFLRKRNSPLADYAQEFVLAADYWNIDYRLVAAISVVESGGGVKTFRKYNAWGWGKSGFKSWEDGIWTVTEGISNGYYSKGLDTPKEISKYYCPPSSDSWARKVSSLMKEIGD